MDWTLAGGLAAALMIATVTAQVGVSGAVFLLPVQLSVFGVPNPAITPTNLLYNVVAGPGALWRYRRDGALRGDLASPDATPSAGHTARRRPQRRHPRLRPPRPERLPAPDRRLAAATWPMAVPAHPHPGTSPATARRAVAPRTLTSLAVAVGVVGGVYGIGGGSLLGPILAGRGMPVTRVAPAALAATFATSLVGAVSYALLSLVSSGDVAPDWWLGLACGTGGLIGGYLGARLQPRLPERAPGSCSAPSPQPSAPCTPSRPCTDPGPGSVPGKGVYEAPCRPQGLGSIDRLG